MPSRSPGLDPRLCMDGHCTAECGPSSELVHSRSRCHGQDDVARCQDNRWTKRLTEDRKMEIACHPRNDKKRRGRQKRRWSDAITAYINTATWENIAQDTIWKLLEEGCTEHWMNGAW